MKPGQRLIEFSFLTFFVQCLVTNPKKYGKPACFSITKTKRGIDEYLKRS